MVTSNYKLNYRQEHQLRCSRLLLFLLYLILLSFPLGKLPLSSLALENRLHLREQDTGQGLHLSSVFIHYNQGNFE